MKPNKRDITKAFILDCANKENKIGRLGSDRCKGCYHWNICLKIIQLLNKELNNAK